MKREWKQLDSVVDDLIARREVDWATASHLGSNDAESRAIDSLRVVASIARYDARQRNEGTVRVEPEPGPTHWGELTLLGKIGQGATAEVYRVQDTRLQMELALKLPRRELLDEFEHRRVLDEARALARVNHPSVVRIYRVEEHEGRAGILMELVRGLPLDRVVRRNGPLGEDVAIQYGLSIAQALAAIHASGLIHRDVKAQNVIVEDGGRLVLMDLGCGIERAVAESADGEWGITGTPYYMAPEILDGAGASPRSDVYSLGVLLFHMVCGDFPVHGDSIAALREAHRQPRRQSLLDLRPDLRPGFVSIVEKAIRPDPARRYATAGQLAGALADLQRRRLGEGERAPRRGLSVRYLAAAFLVALAVAIGYRASTPGAPLTIDLALYREDAVRRERIVSGAAVAPGDVLLMELSSSRPAWTYVISRDDAGEASMLFPLPGGDLRNPVDGEVAHQLPGTVNGRAQGWRVSSVGGREKILVIASRERLPALEELLARLPAAGESRQLYMEVPDETLLRLRGILELEELPGDAPKNQAIADLFDRATELASDRSGVVMRSFELVNPGS